jgi:capsular exopolysaccharide synthesis family protein
MQIKAEDRDPEKAAKAANIMASILLLYIREQRVKDERAAQERLDAHRAQLERELSQAQAAYASVAQSPEAVDGIAAARRRVELKEEAFSRFLDQYERARLAAALRGESGGAVVDPATPSEQAAPRRGLALMLGLLAGLVGGAGLAMLFHRFDPVLYATWQIEEVTGSPALALIPSTPVRSGIPIFDGASAEVEAIRRLRAHLLALDRSSPMTAILVTSASPAEGKSTIVVNLALALAQAGRVVAVIDGDTRRPALHRVFHRPNTVGLVTVLEQKAVLADAVQACDVPGVHLLASGPATDDAAGLLSSPRMAALLEQLRAQFDMILIDAPALAPVCDAAVLAPAVDGVLLVVARGRAREGEVRAALQQLDRVGAKLIGTVISRAGRASGIDAYLRGGARKPARLMDEASAKAPPAVEALEGVGIDGYHQRQR